MKISDLVAESLYNKENGYYIHNNPLGSKNDFITAPEISQIFGEVMAIYLLNIFQNFNEEISLVEMGAGRGVWFYDILHSIHKLAQKNSKIAINFLQKTNFNIIEINQELTKIQQQKLKNYKINWYQNFLEFNKNNLSPIFFISNELFDCFPIDQYIKTKEGWQERLVVFDDKQNLSRGRFVIRNFDKKIDDFVVNQIGNYNANKAGVGAVFEYSEMAQNLMNLLCMAIKQRGGILINFDYGYNFYEFANTLQVIKNHQKIDFFQGLGNADITALVDFVALDKIAKKYQLKTSLISQREFILNLNGAERLQNLINENPAQKVDLMQRFARLVEPNQMGNLFKVHFVW